MVRVIVQEQAQNRDYLGGGKDDAFDQLRLCEDLNLLNDPSTPFGQNHFVKKSSL